MSIRLKEIADAIPHATLIGDPGTLVRRIQYDSRLVQPGDLFVCVKGYRQDGHDFAGDAVASGAVGLITMRKLSLDIPQIVVRDSRQAMGLAAATFYQQPSRKMRVVGVTGTNGKTTTAYMIRSVLQSSGTPCGLIGTVEQWTGKNRREAERTTPESVDIHRLMSEMVENGCTACVMEVSSHGLVLNRTAGIYFDCAVFTNLSRDHFDFHESLDAYLDAKLTLFRQLDPSENPVAIINGDDPHAQAFLGSSEHVRVITYGINGDYDLIARDIDVTPSGTAYVAQTPSGPVHVRLRLPGLFNVYNSLAALAVAIGFGINPDQAALALAETTVSGRFQPVECGQPFSVIVDYSHTPDSLENALKTAKDLARGRVIVVFGAGGNRDQGKRPLMGEVAARYADYIIITSDNPRHEDPEQICAAIAAGVKSGRKVPYEIILDRRIAIETAVNQAAPGDLVLIAGKGHETVQEIRGQRHYFDDRIVAETAIRGGKCSGES